MSSAHPLDDPLAFDGLIARSTALSQASDAADPNIANQLGAIHANYPSIGGGPALALASAGFGPSHPVTQEVAKRSVQRQIHNGFGWHSLGDAVNATVGYAGHLASAGWRDATDVAKPVVRGGLTALESPFQELTGLQRSVAGAASHVPGIGSELAGAIEGGSSGAAIGSKFGPLGAAIGGGIGGVVGGVSGAEDKITGTGEFRSQSSGGIALQRLIRGDNVDLGSGWVPAGDVEHSQRKVARQVAQQQGHALTGGRVIANSVTEPGTVPYNMISGAIDAATLMQADPAVKALHELGQLNAARKTVAVDRVSEFLRSDPGLVLKDNLAKDASPFSIWNKFDGKLPVQAAVDMASTRSTADIHDILSANLGVTTNVNPAAKGLLTRSSALDPMLPSVRSKLESVRWLHDLPRNVVEEGAKPGEWISVKNAVDFSDPNQAVDNVNKYLRATKVDPVTRAQTVDNFMHALVGPNSGHIPAVNGVMDAVKGSLVANGVSAPDAYNLVQYVKDSAEDLRIYASQEISQNQAVPGILIGNDPVPLTGPHLPSEYLNRALSLPDINDINRAQTWMKVGDRNLLELPGVQGTKTLMAGLQSKVWMPAQLIRAAFPIRVLGEAQIAMSMAGHDSVLAHPLQYIARVVGASEAEALDGTKLGDSVEARRAMSHGAMGYTNDDGLIRTKFRTMYSPKDTQYVRSWAEELQKYRSDPLASAAAKTTPDDLKAAFWDGDQKSTRLFLAKQPRLAGMSLATDKAASDAFIDSIYTRMEPFTRAHPDLLQYVADGAGSKTKDEADALTSLKQKLGGLYSPDNAAMPVRVPGDVSISAGQRAGQVWDNATRKMFELTMSHPSNKLANSPLFNETYWNKISELSGNLSPEAQNAALKLADAGKLAPDTQDALLKGISKGSGQISMDQADMVAKAHGLDTVRKTLHDLSARNATAEGMRLIAPFGDAWRLILKRWAGILAEHPEAIRKAQVAVSGAEGSGFFHRDPTSGQEVFSYGPVNWLSDKLLGVSVPLTGDVKGLNLMSQSVMPGVGPMAQIPASYLLPDSPKWDDVSKVVFGNFPRPTGSTEDRVANAFLPAWLKKLPGFFSSPAADRSYANSVLAITDALAATGRYNIHDPADTQRLMNDAKAKAKTFAAIRAISQFFVPSAPHPEFAAQDKDGRTHTVAALSSEFQKMEQADAQHATQNFVDKFGEMALLSAVPRSSSMIYGAPVTKDGMDWANAHPDVRTNLPNTFGFFAPTGGSFDFTAFNRQFDLGERVTLTPKQQIQIANNRLGMMVYTNAKDKLGPHPDSGQRAWLTELRSALVTEYPGFQDPTSLPQKATTPILINELARAVDDPTAASTDAGKGLSLYLQARDKALATGVKSFKSQKAAGTASWLRDVADAVVNEHPDFQPLFDQILSRELPQEGG